jgi:glucan phosphoethanolaminetransferase (alkaline phosphatase superfamily)
MAVTFVMVLGLFLTLSLNRIVFFITVPVVFFLSSIADYFISNYNIRLFNLNVVAFAVETNLEEAAGFVGMELVAWALIAAGVVWGAIALYKRRMTGFPPKVKLSLILLCLLLSTTIHLTQDMPKGLPFIAVSSTVSYFVEKRHFVRLLAAREDISLQPFHGSDEDLTVILIIGESARSDHFHMAGYPRQTTPVMESLGVMPFKNVTACAVSTRISVPCMMTRAANGQVTVPPRETSFISAFRRLGFYTAWISNQRFLGKANTIASAIAAEAEQVYFNNKGADNVYMKFVDEDLCGELEAALRHPGGRKLIVLHTVGSHWLYDNHYPERFRVFQPVCTKRAQKYCSKEEVINAYDNSILYTDHFVGRVIRAVQDSRALVFYVSDHGESLGEEGRYGHGHQEAPPEQKTVPMLVWASEAYFRDDEERRLNLLANLDRGLGHEHLFHSVLDCAGIESPLVDKSMSVCRSMEAGPSQAAASLSPAVSQTRAE